MEAPGPAGTTAARHCPASPLARMRSTGPPLQAACRSPAAAALTSASAYLQRAVPMASRVRPGARGHRGGRSRDGRRAPLPRGSAKRKTLSPDEKERAQREHTPLISPRSGAGFSTAPIHLAGCCSVIGPVPQLLSIRGSRIFEFRSIYYASRRGARPEGRPLPRGVDRTVPRIGPSGGGPPRAVRIPPSASGRRSLRLRGMQLRPPLRQNGRNGSDHFRLHHTEMVRLP